jgi:PAS domain S-box-containing protein
MAAIVPTGREIHFGDEEIIVSKTDLKGHITYANHVFMRVSGYTEAELLGKAHNIIRHPEMPACVFQLLWGVIRERQEIFAYVLNLAKDGGHYWVFAHVTPSYDLAGKQVGYHSNRRVPFPDALPAVKSLYALLCQEERRQTGMNRTKKEAIQASTNLLLEILGKQGKSYGEFVFGLSRFTNPGAAAA